MIKLRAHHLLCLSRFNNKGKWYSKKYKNNFKKIFLKINKNPSQQIIIINKCDDVCKECPHKKTNLCNKPSKYKISHWVRVMDNKTLRLIKLKPNTKHSAKEVLNLIIKKVTNRDLKNICKGCEYLTDCLKLGINKNLIQKVK